MGCDPLAHIGSLGVHARASIGCGERVTKPSDTKRAHIRAQQLVAKLRISDPELVDAAREVDRTLLRETRAMSAFERLGAATRAGRALDGFRGPSGTR